MSDIVYLKIILDKSNPPIWRKVLVPTSVSFFDLHHIFQICMGWRNSHLFQFNVDNYKIGYVDDFTEGFEDVTDAREVTIDLLLTTEGMSFTYLYDFGDYWTHTVTVEKITEREPDRNYPECLEGQLACPTEDSGGIDGFYQNLEILKDKKHPEYSDTKRWVGRGYDPVKFNLEKVNKELPRFKKYMKHWEQ
jgi:hypothetical protein